MEANNARNEVLFISSLCLNAARNEGSCGKGQSGCIYVKKSSISNSRVEKGQIDSALRGGWEREARVKATLLGDIGAKAPPGDSRRRFLIASACRFGGPLLRLGLSKVHGISRAAHALQGGPDSSH